MDENRTLIVIGAGAAGFFAAISCAESDPKMNVLILEKSGKILSKVRVSGGGRCNVTHACFETSELVKFYPRGGRELLGPFHVFSPKDTIAWFHSKGVELKTEADGRMFPVTDQSSTIVDCLSQEALRLGVKVIQDHAVRSIRKDENGLFELENDRGDRMKARFVIVASGGSPSLKGFDWLASFGHKIIDPVPSLFTFNMPDDPITKLMGLSVDSASIKIKGEKISSEGPLLITHWGMSGPAILKLSSVAARKLQELGYQFEILVNWVNEGNEEELRNKLMDIRSELSRKKVTSSSPFRLARRLWEYLLSKALKNPQTEWAQLTNEELRKLAQVLSADVYSVKGKTTFKAEFVTCGGVSLKEVDFKTMQSKRVPGLFFAGEVLDIDAVTGGFNFQAAWTTGHIAGRSVAQSI